MEVKKLHMGPAKIGLDLGDGSERAEYVNQDYILWKLGRPHRCINIMYTYYPNDKEWPARISEAWKDKEVTFAWAYPYDDYFPYRENGEPFNQMKDIRRHGQDVLLTLTIDCGVSDDELRKIAKELKPFGRMRIRINHECDGDWFTHSKRYSYEEVGKFFVRFANILKEEAPNVSTIFCAGMVVDTDDTGKRAISKQSEFEDCYKAADIWSSDKYLSLHYGWPYDIAEPGGGQYCFYTVDEVYNMFKETGLWLRKHYGDKKLTSAELNCDGDVTGPLSQPDSVMRFYHKFRDDNASDWFGGISMYQFRDCGRLGLEIQDPNNKSVGIEQPLLRAYKEILNDDYFKPSMETGDAVAFPAKLRWGGAEDADGIALKIDFEKNPEFCEVTLDKENSYMLEINGRWFYKAPGVENIDLMPAFFDKPLSSAESIIVKLFATPANGENDNTGASDWTTNYYTEIKDEPKFRVRYEVPGVVK